METMRNRLMFLCLFSFFFIAVNYQSADAAGLRKYYLTKDGFVGDEALTACEKGYHMASIWEILDPSNLEYDTKLGVIFEDSGFGPPAIVFGWVRTGLRFSTTIQFPHCRVWTSSSGLDNGTVVLLPQISIEASDSPVEPWTVGLRACDTEMPVWCVEN